MWMRTFWRRFGRAPGHRCGRVTSACMRWRPGWGWRCARRRADRRRWTRPAPDCYTYLTEGWPSGLRRTLGKRVYVQAYRGFESHSLRQPPTTLWFCATENSLPSRRHTPQHAHNARCPDDPKRSWTGGPRRSAGGRPLTLPGAPVAPIRWRCRHACPTVPRRHIGIAPLASSLAASARLCQQRKQARGSLRSAGAAAPLWFSAKKPPSARPAVGARRERAMAARSPSAAHR